MGLAKSWNKYTYFFLLFIVLMGYYEYQSIDNSIANLQFVDLDILTFGEQLSLFLLTIVSILVFFSSQCIFKKEKNNSVVKYFVAFMAIFITINFLHVLLFGYNAGTIMEYVSWFSPLFVFLASYEFTYRMKNPNFQAFCYVFVTIILIYGYYNSFQYIHLIVQSGEQVQLMTYYFALYFLPLAVCLNFKPIRYLMIAILIIAAVTSGKRTGAVSLLLGVLVYFYLKIKSQKNGGVKTGRLFLFAVVLIIGYFVVSSLLQNSDLFLFQRLSNIGDDQGSGRTEWYGKVLSETLNSNIIYYIFGHGYKGVLMYLHDDRGADTDLLEVPFDYGIFGTIIYWLFVISLIYYTIRLTKNHSDFAAPFGMSITIYLVASTLSHVIVYPYFWIIFALSWGYMIAGRKLEIEMNCLQITGRKADSKTK